MANDRIGADEILALATLSNTAARANGWWEKERNLGEMIALIHSELAEFRDVVYEPEPVRDTHLVDRYNADVELADTFIRLGDMLGGYGVSWSEDESKPCWHIFFATGIPTEQLEAQILENLLIPYRFGSGVEQTLRTGLQALKALPPKEDLTSYSVLYDFASTHLTKFCDTATTDMYLLYLHSLLSRTLERQRKNRCDAVLSLDLFLLMTSIDVYQAQNLRDNDFAAIVRQKIRFNVYRGKKHGKAF